ncbi:MAG TPA: CDP-alcohol phosphatidyltransferase family protein [Myxococcota bacterium]|nr:CDP-alcohol phosphatidyltransferase family protein [Myxococcota bacterium]
MGLRVWIDATAPESALRLFGMSLVERQLAALAQLNGRGEISSVVVEHARAAPPALRADLVAKLRVTLAEAHGALAERIGRAAAASQSALLALPGDAIVDTRLLAKLVSAEQSVAALGGEGAQRSALVRVAPGARLAPSDATELRGFAEDQLRAGALRELALGEIEEHITNLRRDQPAYAFRIQSADVATTERWLFWSNYKGSTDFLTRWVFPPFVWAAVRPLARWRVHPNWVTGLAVLLCIAAIPLWAAQHWWLGFAAAYTMAVLDSVDGKLARLTYTTSPLGDVMDHGTDLIHPPFWYAAWAWGLAGGPRGATFELTLWLFGLYALDRLLAPIFKAITGKSIHGYAPIDVKMRTFISRRNVNLPVFTLALPLGLGAEAIVLVFAWQGVCFVFHAVRTVQVWRELRFRIARSAR